jgi:hypothetical protein
MGFIDDENRDEVITREAWVFHTAQDTVIRAYTPYPRSLDLSVFGLLGTAEPTPAKRSAIVGFTPFDTGATTFTFPEDDTFARDVSLGAEGRAIFVTIYGLNDLGTWAPKWKGRIRMGRIQAGKCLITCEAAFYTDAQKVSRTITYGCWKTLYGAECKATKNFIIYGVVTFPTRPSEPIIISGGSDLRNGGVVRFPSGDERQIVKVELDGPNTKIWVIDLLTLPTGLPINSVEIATGCDKTFDTCSNVFANSVNFGGFQYIPQKDIYEG